MWPVSSKYLRIDKLVLSTRSLLTYHIACKQICTSKQQTCDQFHAYTICFQNSQRFSKCNRNLPRVDIILHQRGSGSRQRRPLSAEGMSETAVTQLVIFPCHHNDAQNRLQLWLQQQQRHTITKSQLHPPVKHSASFHHNMHSTCYWLPSST